MQIELTSEDAQVLQSSIHRTIQNLKNKLAELHTDRQNGFVSPERYESGKRKLGTKIDHLRRLDSALEPAKQGVEDLFEGFELVVISTWEGEGGLCLN